MSDNLSFIISEKGITKKEFGELLQVAGLYKNPEQTWNTIHTDLAAAGAGIGLINQYKAAWRDASVRLLNQPNNIPLNKTMEHVSFRVKTGCDVPSNLNLNVVDLVDSILLACQPLPYDLFDEQFIKGVILKELYND